MSLPLLALCILLVIMDVRYVIASEFDIDVGATVKYHYPNEEQPLFKRENGFANLLIPDQAHHRGEDWGYFCLYEDPETKILDYTPSRADSRVLYVANTLQTKTGEEIKRGARIYSLSIVASEPFSHVFKPVLLLAIDDYIHNPEAARLAELHACLRSIDMTGMPKFSWAEKRLLQLNQNQSLFREYYLKTSGESSELSDTHFYDVVAKYKNLQIPLRIPTDVDYYNPGEFSLCKLVELCSRLPVCHGFHKEVTVYGPPTPALIVLWTSILTEKRILFVSDTETACGELAGMVLACGFFGSAGGLLNTPFRVFPYVDLGRIDHLRKTGGYIAGVTNQAFLLHPEWWDLAIHIEKRTIELSPRLHRKLPERFPLHNPIDFEFVDNITRAALDRHGERVVRHMALDYTTQFLRRSAGTDLEKMAMQLRSRSEHPTKLIGSFGHYFSNQAERAQFMTVYVTVYNSWKRHQSYAYYLKQVSTHEWPSWPRPLIDFANLERQLRTGKLDPDQAAQIYQDLCEGMKDDDDITLYLALSNTVYYLNLGLYHPSSAIRSMVCELMGRIKNHPAGVFYYLELPPYHAIALERAERKLL